MGSILRVAAAGAGYFSQFHHRAWRRMADAGLVELVAIYNRTADKAREVAASNGIPAVYDDFHSMLREQDIDLVDVITPPETHSEFVTAAVDRGVAAICQKPFTPSLAEARRLCRHIDSQNGRVFVHENFRFQPWYSQIRALLDDGMIGEPYQVTFRLRPGDGQGPDAYLSRQPYFQKMPRFLVHETAIHLVDTFRFLFGEVVSVCAWLSRLNPVIEGEDAGIVLFEFANGQRGIFDGNRLADHPAENRRLTMGTMVIEGSAGTLTLDGNGDLHLRPFGANEARRIDFSWNDVDFGGDCVYLTNRHIVEHLTSGSPAANTAAEYLTNLRIEAAIYQSAELGQTVRTEQDAP